jgi:hypothetical protein
VLKRLSALALACAVVNASGAVVFAATQAERDAKALAEAKAKIHRAGTGDRARVRVKLKDGREVKGYVAESGEDDFVVRDTKTDAPTTIAFADVSKVNKLPTPMTKAQNTAAYVGAGLGALVIVLMIVAATRGID